MIRTSLEIPQIKNQNNSVERYGCKHEAFYKKIKKKKTLPTAGHIETTQ